MNIEGAPKVLLCFKYGAIPTIISGVMAFWKKTELRPQVKKKNVSPSYGIRNQYLNILNRDA